MAAGGEGRGAAWHAPPWHAAAARPQWSRDWRGSVRERTESMESRQSSEAGCAWREDSWLSMCREDSGVTVDSTLGMSREHSGVTVASSTGYMFGESGELNYMFGESGELNGLDAGRRVWRVPCPPSPGSYISYVECPCRTPPTTCVMRDMYCRIVHGVACMVVEVIHTGGKSAGGR